MTWQTFVSFLDGLSIMVTIVAAILIVVGVLGTVLWLLRTFFPRATHFVLLIVSLLGVGALAVRGVYLIWQSGLPI